MADDKQQKTGDFKVLNSAEPVKYGRNQYFISEQEISQESGSSSTHLVMKKVAMNEDGSPRGQSRQIFIPTKEDEAEKVLKYALDFLQRRKKSK